MRDTGKLERLPKKEQLKLNDEIAKLSRMLGGIRGMRRLPDALFVVDTRKEHIAIHEAQRLDIPIVALLDTNSDPDEVTYPIPANDDAIRAVRLLSGKIADAAYEGAQERASTVAKEEAEEGFEPGEYEGYTFEPGDYVATIDAINEDSVQPDEAIETEELEIGNVGVPLAVAAVGQPDDAELSANTEPEPTSAARVEPETASENVELAIAETNTGVEGEPSEEAETVSGEPVDETNPV
jgi:hypothetical protein